MAKYPIKMLKDEEGTPFVPLVSADSVYVDADTTFQDSLDKKLEITNLKGSDSVSITKQGNDATFEVNFGAANNIIDNLNTTVAGQGSLDARQGNVLKNMIPAIADNLTTTDANKVLSANQGKVLGERTVKNGGTTGQVLKKASDNDYDLEWGDAADPNAIVGDGSITSIIELTYEEYKTLEAAGNVDPNTEYHITDAQSTISKLQETLDGLQSQLNEIKSTYLPLTGGTLTGGVNLTKTSYNFNKGAIPGVKLSSATTLPELLTEVRYSNGQMGSVNFSSDYNSTITHGWWLYLYIPHRIGGINGTKNGDNTDWGVLFLIGMTVQLGKMYTVNFQNGAISTIAEH
jgi:hypothetical protein